MRAKQGKGGRWRERQWEVEGERERERERGRGKERVRGGERIGGNVIWTIFIMVEGERYRKNK